jgi:hypothetical protein
MIFSWYCTHTASGCQTRPGPAAVAIHGKRAVTISLPGPHHSALGVESLLFMRKAPAEMGRGHCGRNPASLMSKTETTPEVAISCVVVATRQEVRATAHGLDQV